MFDKLPVEAQQFIAGIIGLLPTAALARLLLHRQLVRTGHRKFWSREFVWELPTAIFCAIIGGGIAAYFDMPTMAGHGVVGAVGWLGPRGMEALLSKWAERRKT